MSRLARILDEAEEMDVDASATPSPAPSASPTQTTAAAAHQQQQRRCCECDDQPAVYVCGGCGGDAFCKLCYGTLHRKGSRAAHVPGPVPGLETAFAAALQATSPVPTPAPTPSAAAAAAPSKPKAADESSGSGSSESSDSDDEPRRGRRGGGGFFSSIFGGGYGYGYGYGLSQRFEPAAAPAVPREPVRKAAARENPAMIERCTWIPVRLSLRERKTLRLVEATLAACGYTNAVDGSAQLQRRRRQRVHEQIRGICSVLLALRVATDRDAGLELSRTREFSAHADFFRAAFEIARRHKIMNPDRMRTEYAKLVYILQDAQTPEVRELLEFELVAPLVTVRSFLESRGAGAVMSDEDIETATKEVVPAPGKSRRMIDREIKAKERAIERIGREYCSARISPDEIKLCLYSISDNNSFLRANRDPIDRIIGYLKHDFPADDDKVAKGQWSLAISGGEDGARLTHTHENQHIYVLQSLTLWREIQNHSFKLWILAEQDLLRPGAKYELVETGQGLNRVQNSPQIYRTMQGILQSVQKRVGSWVGSSVIHLGDQNVPNALYFIDKYVQVPRILGPIVLTIDSLPKLCEKSVHVARYFDSTFGGVDRARMTILHDLFRHAFDGSGADNFFAAGSCIDGRLTSAWNWCNSLSAKPFFHIFLLAGFIGFDGEWK